MQLYFFRQPDGKYKVKCGNYALLVPANDVQAGLEAVYADYRLSLEDDAGYDIKKTGYYEFESSYKWQPET